MTDLANFHSQVLKFDVPAIAIYHGPDQHAFLIMNDGRVFWKNHEVIGDDEFKSAMLDLSIYIQTGMCRKCADPDSYKSV